MQRAWERAIAGHHTAVIGGPVGEPPGDLALRLVRVHCRTPTTRVAGPLRDARRRIEALLGEEVEVEDERRDRAALRRRLLGLPPEPTTVGALVALFNRLAEGSPKPTALVLEAVEAADYTTLRLLAAVLSRPGWLRLPLILSFAGVGLDEAVRQLVDTLRRAEGAGAIIEIDGGDALDERDALPELPDAVTRVLRAGAAVGPGFEAELVGALLRVESLDVLEALQLATDRGVPIEDYGDGRFSLPEAVLEYLRATTLPSLTTAWNRRLGQLLSQPELRPAALEGGQDLDWISGPEGIADEARADGPAALDGRDERAAEHFARAGEVELSALGFLTAATEAAELGAYQQALDYGQRALSTLDEMSPSDRRRVLRIKAHAEIGRLQWEAAGPGSAFSLPSAAESLERARALLQSDDPAILRADVDVLSAAVHYEIGDEVSLKRALDELTEASRVLLDGGLPVEAASLLNDQAAVWVRLGDPVRANEQLEQSREVFARRARTDPAALLELAETDHLIARLPMHVPAKSGHDLDAAEAALQRAVSAEEVYAELGDEREQARVWETMARLHLMAGRPDEARELLTSALEVQREVVDQIGLARTTAALAELLASEGQIEEALVQLRESAALNLEKGSPVGLGYNRRALESLVELARVEAPDLLEAVEALGREILQAEDVVGRAEVH